MTDSQTGILSRLAAVAAMDLRTGGFLAHTMDTAAEAKREIERLRAAAERVCWFDWSDNDDDAVQAIADLRKLISVGPAEGGK